VKSSLTPQELGDKKIALMIVPERVEYFIIDEQQLVERVLVEAHLLKHVEGGRGYLLEVAETYQSVQERQAPVVKVVQTRTEKHPEKLDDSLGQVRRTFGDPDLQHFSCRACETIIKTINVKIISLTTEE
jgi:hypothetical protein